MKKWVILIVAFALTFMLCACGGNVKSAEIVPMDSEIYSQKDIDAAIKTATRFFASKFSGCTLKVIRYIGDECAQDFDERAAQHNADEAIVLISSFDVDSSGGDGSLNPNSTYTNWQWVLVRDAGGSWRHVDHGYG